jgi:hypothetical protein
VAVVSGRARAALVALALTLVGLTACAPRDAAVDLAGRARELVPEVERAVGRKFKTPPRVEVQPRDEVKKYIEKQYTDPRAQREVAGQETAYKRLGLIPETLDLRALFLELLEEQVVGYYDPKTKVLYVVEGSDPDLAPAIIRHELVHALQDQYVNLDSLLHVEGQNDRQTAVQAAIEGHAIWVQLAQGNAAATMPGGWDRIRDEIRSNQDATPVFSKAPIAIRESLLFPYLSGAEFVRRLAERNAVDSMYANLPASSEQVLHAASYFGATADSGGRRTADEPTVVTLPAPAAGTKSYENTVGEFEIRLLVYTHLEELPLAARAAGGWDGDRYMVVRSSAGDAIAWVTVWDSAVDAGEFFDAIGQGVSRRYPGLNATAAGGTRTYLVPSTAERGARTVTVRATEIGGRPVVTYVDVPAGLPPELLDMSRVTLR